MNWEESIISANDRQCTPYRDLFRKKREPGEKEGDKLATELFGLLEKVVSFHLDLDSSTEPFKPSIILNNLRSPIPDDLTDSEKDLLKELISEITDPELRARVADVVWVTKRDYPTAMIAVDAYLESFQNLLDEDMWVPCLQRIERALQLAAMLGKTIALIKR